MSNTIKSNETVCAEPSTFSRTNTSLLTSHVISSLAASKTCGLAILVDKLLVNGTLNASTKHLINSLINRFHRHSIEVAVSSEDDPESYICQILEKATQYTLSDTLNRNSVDTAAKLLTRAIAEFESNQVDFQTLEHNWKEFIFHFYRFQLNRVA
jgi:hypothetical protein